MKIQEFEWRHNSRGLLWKILKVAIWFVLLCPWSLIIGALLTTFLSPYLR